MAWALETTPADLSYRVIIVFSSNKSAIQAVSQPRQQSGQQEIRRIYEAVNRLTHNWNKVSLVYVPSGADYEVTRAAKAAARQSTTEGSVPSRRPTRTRGTTLGAARAERWRQYKLPDGVGKFSKKVDTALPGKHTRQLYDALSWREASILAQLRTGMARLNGYLHLIGVVASKRFLAIYIRS